MNIVLVGAGEVGANQRGELVVPNLKIEGVSVEPPSHQSIQTLLETASHENSTTIQNHSNLLTQVILVLLTRLCASTSNTIDDEFLILYKKSIEGK